MSDIFDIMTVDLELDSFSKLTRSYTSKGFKELADDIEEYGVKEPIAIRKGKILDGRHRYLACKERVVDLPYKDVGNITDEEALDFVISKAISKDSMSTSAKIEAFLLCKAKGIANNKMPNKFSRLSMNDVKKIAKINKSDPEYLQILLKQQDILINDIRYKCYKTVSSINSLWNIIVSNEKELKGYEAIIDVESIERAEQSFVSSYFNGNDDNEHTFWTLYNISKDSGDSVRPSSKFGIALMDIIKSNNVIL